MLQMSSFDLHSKKGDSGFPQSQHYDPPELDFHSFGGVIVRGGRAVLAGAKL